MINWMTGWVQYKMPDPWRTYSADRAVDRVRQHHRWRTSHILPASHAAFCTDHTSLDQFEELIRVKFFHA
jgi:hypothetical protein